MKTRQLMSSETNKIGDVSDAKMSNLGENNSINETPSSSGSGSKSESDENRTELKDKEPNNKDLGSLENEIESQKDENKSTGTGDSVTADASAVEKKIDDSKIEIDDLNRTVCVKNSADDILIGKETNEDLDRHQKDVLNVCKNDFVNETKSMTSERAPDDDNSEMFCNTNDVVIIDDDEDETEKSENRFNETNYRKEQSLAPKVSNETNNLVEKVVETDHNVGSDQVEAAEINSLVNIDTENVPALDQKHTNNKIPTNINIKVDAQNTDNKEVICVDVPKTVEPNVAMEIEEQKSTNNEDRTNVKNKLEAQEADKAGTADADVIDVDACESLEPKIKEIDALENINNLDTENVAMEVEELKDNNNEDRVNNTVDAQEPDKMASTGTEVIDVDEVETLQSKNKETNSLVNIENLDTENVAMETDEQKDNNIENPQEADNADSTGTEIIDVDADETLEPKIKETNSIVNIDNTETKNVEIDTDKNGATNSKNRTNAASSCTEVIDVDAAEPEKIIIESAEVPSSQHIEVESSKTINSAENESQIEATSKVSESIDISDEKEQNTAEAQNNNIEIIEDDDVIELSDNEGLDCDVLKKKTSMSNEHASGTNLVTTSCAADNNVESTASAGSADGANMNCDNINEQPEQSNVDDDIMLVEQDESEQESAVIEISDDEVDSIDMTDEYEEDISIIDEINSTFDSNIDDTLQTQRMQLRETRNATSTPSKRVQKPVHPRNQVGCLMGNKNNRSPAFTAMQFSPTLEANSVTGLLGVGYVLQIMEQQGDKNPKYDCCLCEVTYKAVSMQEHLESTQHRLAYCSKHFPTVLRQFRQCIANLDAKSGEALLSLLLKKLAIAIELHHGRDLPTNVLKSVYQTECHEVRNKVFSMRFASEQNGPTFANVVDLSQLDALKKQAANSSSIASSENVTFNRSPVVNAQRTFPQRSKRFIPNRFHNRSFPYRNKQQKKIYQRQFQQRNQIYPFAPMLTAPAKNVMNNSFREMNNSFNDMNTNFNDMNNSFPNSNYSMMQMQIEPNRQLDASLPPFKSILKQSVAENFIPNDCGQQYKSPVAFNVNQPQAQTQLSIISTNQKSLEERIEEINKLFSAYKNDPNSYPNYKKEWEIFWKTRKRELMQKGLDHYNYDYKAEWMHFFSGFLIKKHAELIENLMREDKGRVNYAPPVANIQSKSDLDAGSNKHQTFGKCSKLLSVLRLLCALEEHLGCSTSDVMQILNETLKAERKHSSENNLGLLNLENCAVLRLVAEKFKGIVLAEIVDEKKSCVLRKAIHDIEELLFDV